MNEQDKKDGDLICYDLNQEEKRNTESNDGEIEELWVVRDVFHGFKTHKELRVDVDVNTCWNHEFT